MDGASVLAQSLADQGVDIMFGVVGIPVIEVGMAAQSYGIKYVGMRNEQAASYAAGAVGYMTQRPGCCLVVSGPGVIHGIAGLANAWANCWPMILIGGANDRDQNGKGAFQECPQIEACRPYVKYIAQPDSVERIPFFIEQAVRMSIQGRPGPVYIDLPGNLVTSSADSDDIVFPPKTPSPYITMAPPELVENAYRAIQSAERPLVIVGKGAAYARAENQVIELVERLNLPFLATPMGKGVVPDDHKLSAAAARSLVLRRADVILLIGARLNWILHFGLPPRFARDVKVIHIDISAEEIGNNVPAHIALVGDANAVVSQMNQVASRRQTAPTATTTTATWLAEIQQKVKLNVAKTEELMKDESVPMTYYRAYRDIRDVLPRDCIIIGEGANTMDIGRTIMHNYLPRHRLDAGTFGTMGVGVGFALAAAMVHPTKKVVAVQGDSAFGFSAMEVETICRYKLPITFIVINNGGIYQGVDELPEDMHEAPPTALMPNARYDVIVTAFGGKGYHVRHPNELRGALDDAMRQTVPTVVNVIITPSGERKAQEFEWLTRSNL